MSDLLSAPRRAWLNRQNQCPIVTVHLRLDAATIWRVQRISRNFTSSHFAANLRTNGAIIGSTPTRTDTGRRCGFLSHLGDGFCRGVGAFIVRYGIESQASTTAWPRGTISLSLRHDQGHWVQVLCSG